MISNVSAFSHRPMLKFGDASHTYQAINAHPEPSLVKGVAQVAESPAAQKAKALAKPSVHAAFEIAPAIIRAVNGAVAASVGLYLSKRLAERLFPAAAEKSIEHKLKEARLTERAKEMGKVQSKLMGFTPLFLIAGGALTKLGEKAGEKLIEMPFGFVPKHLNELEKLEYQNKLHTARETFKTNNP